jgi:hypothetical protein
VPFSFDKVKLVLAATPHESFKVESQVEFPAHHLNCNINRQRLSEMQVLGILFELIGSYGIAHPLTLFQ